MRLAAKAWTPARTAIRLALLDDHEVLLDSLATWIDANAPDFRGRAAGASTWLQLVHSDRFPTELVFLDFQLREPVSIEARVRTCRAAGAKVIVLTSLDTQESRDRALAAGAAAFLSKELPMREVMDVARAGHAAGDVEASLRAWRPLPQGSRAAAPEAERGRGGGLRLYATGLTHEPGRRVDERAVRDGEDLPAPSAREVWEGESTGPVERPTSFAGQQRTKVPELE